MNSVSPAGDRGRCSSAPRPRRAILTSLVSRVLFIDEIHRMSPAIEEVLYRRGRLELDIIIGQGPAQFDKKYRCRSSH